MLARIFRQTIFVLLLPILVLAGLYCYFTILPHLSRALGLDQSETVSVDGKSISLDKAIIAKACNGDGTICLDNVLLLSGYIDEGMITKAKQVATERQISTLCFASRGGSKDTAIRIGKWISDNNFNTCMADQYFTTNGLTVTSPLCASACPFILAMGEDRTALGNRFKIGIHSSGTTLDFGFFSFSFSSSKSDAVDKYEDMLKVSNGNTEHLNMLQDSLQTGFESKKYLSQEEQRRYALFTQYR